MIAYEKQNDIDIKDESNFLHVLALYIGYA
jgi:hypothetical protein